MLKEETRSFYVDKQERVRKLTRSRLKKKQTHLLLLIFVVMDDYKNRKFGLKINFDYFNLMNMAFELFI